MKWYMTSEMRKNVFLYLSSLFVLEVMHEEDDVHLLFSL